MKTKIISELKNGLGFAQSRGEVAAQEQMRILQQGSKFFYGNKDSPI
jgi:hypothetical protein